MPNFPLLYNIKYFVNVNFFSSKYIGYKVLQVVTNNATAYIHTTNIKKWDICAGNAILNAVGGKMTNLQNESIDYATGSNPVNDKGLLATLVHHQMYLTKISDQLKNTNRLR